MIISEQEKELLIKSYSSIKVVPLDMEKLNSEININVKANRETEDNIKYSTIGKFAIIDSSNIFIDEECVGMQDSKITLNIYANSYDANGNLEGIGIFPKFTNEISIKELVANYGLAEVDLPTFMGDRFAYNYRIINNMREIKSSIK